ncbi:hypothetical protein CHS0354_013692 [Potamilus streckersoni]|uniref:KY-like immunoglobulin-like domain-containing protein n=1 Tax=Potamilus streckersoni TaxID=2493646 RepID=A0AAE0T1C6_9BIVA|nr:hypothetical protein CHS0354_013692 [Potamilus streckersoni]
MNSLRPSRTPKSPISFHGQTRRKEIEFWDTIKSHLTYKGYYDSFPTPKLLRQAQDEYRSIRISPPLDSNNKPLPYPTPCPKEELMDRQRMFELDRHSLEAQRVLAYEDLYKLVKYLVEPAKTEVEKLRTIFRWIAAQDLKQWHDDVSFNADSAAWYLARIRGKKANHNQLLQRMCNLANIYCVKIRGYVKGVDYGLGHELTECDSTWSAVLVDGSWRLMDVYWATCHRVHSGDKSWELIDDGTDSLSSHSSTPRSGSSKRSMSKTEYSYNDYYFLTDPEQYIYSHFPVDEKWQLLARTVSIEEAKQLALLKRNFFSLGLDIVSHARYLVECDSGEVQLSFTKSDNSRINFKYELYIATETNADIVDTLNSSLDRYVFLENPTKEEIVNVKIRFPSIGKFKLKILAKEADEHSYYYTCTYIIDCLKAMENCQPLPTNERGEWGPGLDTEALGLNPVTHSRGEVEAEDGKAEVRFQMNQPVEFEHRLIRGENEELHNRVLHRIEDKEAVFNVRVPQEGEYALNLYAREKGSNKDFPNVCNYLLKCEEEPDDKTPFPAVSSLGPTGAFQEMGLENISDMPALMLAPATGEITLQFRVSKPAIFIPELLLQQDDKQFDFSEYMMWDILNEVATFYANIPRQGLYSLAIRAKSSHEQDTYVPIFNAVIDAIVPKKQCFPFPQQSVDWPSKCHVNEPMSGILPARELTSFSIEYPDAFEVVVTSGNGSKTLARAPNDAWNGDILTGNEDSVVTVAVRYHQSDDLRYILTYKVAGKDYIIEERRRQLERYRDAVQRAERLKESGKLPFMFDWSRLESVDSGTEMEEEETPNSKACQTVLTLLEADLTLTSAYLYYGE